MKLSPITYASVLAALVAVGCGDNNTNKPASDPSMARTTSAAQPSTTSTNDMSGSQTPSPAWNSGSTATPQRMNTTPGAGASAPSPAATMPSSGTPSAPSNDADNTRMNERDRSGATATPVDQGNNATDTKITAEIRKAVVADSALSFNAKNVKIITNGTRVVLRGTVNSIAERQSIEAKARAVPGVTDVSNLIDVKK